MTTYTLHIQYPDRPAQTLSFTNTELIIGRESGDIPLGDPMASGHHGKLTLNTLGQTLTYTDLNSSNGSRHLNGEPITAPTQLGPGHAVRIGQCILTVRSIGDAQPRATANRGGTVLGGASPLAGGFLRRPGGKSGPSPLTPKPVPVAHPPVSAGSPSVSPTPDPAPLASAPSPVPTPAGASAVPNPAMPVGPNPAPMATPPVGAPIPVPVPTPVEVAPAPVTATPAPAPVASTPIPSGIAAGHDPAPISVNGATEPIPAAATPSQAPPPSAPVGDLLDPKRTTSFGEAWGLLMKTWPYLVARWTVYGLYALGCLIWFCVWGGLAYLFHESGSLLTVFIVIAVGGFGAIAYWLKRYVLYLLKAGHIAVITELIKRGSLPEGVNQVEYGKGIVTQRFGEVSALFAVDALVTGVLRMISRAIISITNLIPIPGLDKIGRIVTAIINRALTYIDEAIFSYTLLTGSTNPWASARTGIVLYGQSWKPLLKSAFKVWILGQLAWFAAFLVILLPTYGLMMLMPDASFILGIMAVILALLVVSAFYEPLALVYMILTFNRAIQGQTPSAEWEEKIGKVSKKFRSLSQKAANWVAPNKEPTATGGQPPQASP